jgi:hypothetical protein
LRAVAVGVLLLAVYAATLSIPATAGERYAGDEPHHLLAARSWTDDGDVDLADQYAQRQWAEFTDVRLEPSGGLTRGRLHECRRVCPRPTLRDRPLLLGSADGRSRS